MASLTDAIPPGSLVGIDTVVFIYQIEASPRYQEIVRPLFEEVAAGRYGAITSVITLMELAVHPLRLGKPEVADDYELLLLNYPHLTVHDVTPSVARRAADLRSAYRLHPPDSLQLGTAVAAGAGYFVSNDQSLRRVAGIRVLLVDDFTPDE